MKLLLAITGWALFSCSLPIVTLAQPTSAQTASAQTTPAASLQGLQERSVTASAAPTPVSTTIPNGAVVVDPTDVGVVLRQLNDRTQLVLSPARDDLRRWDSSGSGLTGDNKVQVIYGGQQR